MTLENELEMLRFLFSDKKIEVTEFNIEITEGNMKKVMNYLYDCGINFRIHDNMVKFNKNELRWITD